MATFFFAVVMLHLLIGFGWVLYKIAVPPRQKKSISDAKRIDAKGIDTKRIEKDKQ
ncbi:hypothetical protein [Hugenholtzia roseola]|uniref:hypothetical protein n=1 Tax=Hugenholtzia roseola TaxID=1002 RepID=UPI0004016445|nr:hypothetical protein [Hugenholtzia roseola]